MKYDYFIRPSETKDLYELKSIWQICFGDSDTETNSFFKTFFNENKALVLSCEGKIVAAAHILYFSELFSEGITLPCPYIYGIGVLPEYRGRGFGAEITNAASKHCRSSGYDLCALVPASESLYEYYSEKAGFKSFFAIDEYVYTGSENRPSFKSLQKISSDEYNSLREHYLSHVSHIKFNATACEYLSVISSETGGGLFKLTGRSEAIAAVFIGENTLMVKELLCQLGDIDLSLQTLSEYFGIKKCVARTPGKSKPFGMVKIFKPGLELSGSYWGPAFD